MHLTLQVTLQVHNALTCIMSSA